MMTENQQQDDLNKALDLFRYLPAKDIFETFYNKRLAKRILLNLSDSYDLEKYVI